MVYYLYGVRLLSEWPLPYPRDPQPFLTDIALVRRPADFFAIPREAATRVSPPRASIIEATFSDGSTYLQWRRRFEFLIAGDGLTIAARPLGRRWREGFHTYLLGQALSFALIQQGFDPVHATVVTIDGMGAAFVGYSGFGKSSLAAAFLAAGHRLLTDDLLVLTEGAAGFSAHPGPPRLKLYPTAARRLLPRAQGTQIMPTTPKLLIPLGRRQTARSAIPLRAMYMLVSPVPRRRRATAVTIQRLGPTQACLAMVRNTFNSSIVDAGRLSRQFSLATRIADRIPVKRLSYRRSYAGLAAVRAAVIADLERENG